MESVILESGLYAVFIYKGDGSDAEEYFGTIFQNIIPSSRYELDDRYHFEVLGNKYKRGHPDSEEEVWVPIKFKN